MTNFEKIKAMTVEEMAKLLFELTSPCGYTRCLDGNCFECVKKYLESEVEEND